MHPEDIKAALRKRGSSQADIARALSVSKVTVCYVIEGRSTSRRVAQAVANAAGLTMEAAWPGKYGPARARGGRRP